MSNSNNYLLIHGAYHGAWCWEEVKEVLEDKENVVYTIDLPGHGKDKTDRSKINVSLYVTAVKKFIEENNINNVTLVGHSFAGVVITKLIEVLPNRIKDIVLISAVVLDNGEAFFDYFPQEIKEKYLKQANESEDNSITPNSASLRARLFNDLVDDNKFENIFNKLTPQPILPYTEKIYLKDFKETSIPIYYIFCKNDISLSPESFKKILSKLPPKFKKIEIQSDHEVMFSHPKELVEVMINR